MINHEQYDPEGQAKGNFHRFSRFRGAFRRLIGAFLSTASAAVTLLCCTVLVSTALQIGATASQNAKPEVRRTYPLTKFYDTPSPLPRRKAGELIRKEQFDEYDLSSSVLATRILYHSRSAAGGDVATSGVVLYPDGTAPAGGWPLIAWAHDLNGVARQCAPSLSRNLEHGPFLSMYVNLGYAVVATDYTGLGTTFRNAFSDMQSNAADIVYSVAAARTAVPQLGSHWLAVGATDGGLAVMGVAEMQYDLKDPNYLGGILITGLSDLEDRYQSPDLAALLFLAYGIKTLYPQFDPKDILQDKAQALLPAAEHACAGAEINLAVSDVTKPNWRSNRFVQEYFGRNRAGQKPAYGPLLAISDADANGRAAQVIGRMCKQGDVVQFEKFAASDSSSVIGESVTDQIAWIRGRFAGSPAPHNCSQTR